MGSDTLPFLWVGLVTAVGLTWVSLAVSVWRGKEPYASAPRRELVSLAVREGCAAVVMVCAVVALVWSVSELTGTAF